MKGWCRTCAGDASGIGSCPVGVWSLGSLVLSAGQILSLIQMRSGTRQDMPTQSIENGSLGQGALINVGNAWWKLVRQFQGLACFTSEFPWVTLEDAWFKPSPTRGAFSDWPAADSSMQRSCSVRACDFARVAAELLATACATGTPSIIKPAVKSDLTYTGEPPSGGLTLTTSSWIHNLLFILISAVSLIKQALYHNIGKGNNSYKHWRLHWRARYDGLKSLSVCISAAQLRNWRRMMRTSLVKRSPVMYARGGFVPRGRIELWQGPDCGSPLHQTYCRQALLACFGCLQWCSYFLPAYSGPVALQYFSRSYRVQGLMLQWLQVVQLTDLTKRCRLAMQRSFGKRLPGQDATVLSFSCNAAIS